MRYSQSTGGFYSPDINGDNIPFDAVEITDDQWRTLLAGQSQGKVIVASPNGSPRLENPPQVVTVPQQILKANARIILARNGLLNPMMAYINGLPDDDEDKIIFLDMVMWTRDSVTLDKLAKGVLHLTDAQIDQFFIDADQLSNL